MAAREPMWRPLGDLLVSQGVVTEDELALALDEQERSGQRLGEILIARRYASRVAIMDALIEQAGLLLEFEQGFGFGLRDQIERRHREARGRQHPGGADAAASSRRDGDGIESSDLDEALQGQIAEAAARTGADANDGSPAETPAAEFLAAVLRARRHLVDRRAKLAGVSDRPPGSPGDSRP